jgi:methionine-rich copper-binding protein CopC
VFASILRRRPPAILAIGCALLLAGASPAAAHAILIRSTPAIGASVAAGTVSLDLHYNSRIDAGRSRLTLIRADRSTTTVPILPTDAPDALRAQVALTPGSYVVRWQVLATDGHITRG